MSVNAKILLAEDDDSLGFVIEDHLTEAGYEVCWAKNGKEGLAAFSDQHPDLCILDVMMPQMDGFTLAKTIRKKDEFIPILFLTAREQEEDRLRGFEVGGDDYICKPFSMQELLYRVRVFLRRSAERSEPAPTTDTVQIGSYTFDLQDQKLVFNHQTHHLTYMESQLLQMLAESKNQIVKREDILLKIWGENDYFKGRSLDVFISRLRKYLSGDPSITIKNHHGVGFSLRL
jgi:DNA-binding response OmpR family regulator